MSWTVQRNRASRNETGTASDSRSDRIAATSASYFNAFSQPRKSYRYLYSLSLVASIFTRTYRGDAGQKIDVKLICKNETYISIARAAVREWKVAYIDIQRCAYITRGRISLSMSHSASATRDAAPGRAGRTRRIVYSIGPTNRFWRRSRADAAAFSYSYKARAIKYLFIDQTALMNIFLYILFANQ